VGEYDSTGTLSATNVFGADGLISRRTGGASVFYNYDDRGNAVQSLDGSGNSYYVFEYDVWGNRTQPVGNTPGPWDMGARFGYYTDTETGLSLLTHRFYSPSVGRFLTRDPMGYRGGINLYGYTRNNPVNQLDPSGLYVDIGVSAGGVIGVVGGVQIDPSNYTTSLYGGCYFGVGTPIGISIQGSPGSPTQGGFVNLYGGAGPAAAGGVSGIGTKNSGPSGSGGVSTPGAGIAAGYVGPPVSYGGSPGLPGGPSVPNDPYSTPVGPGMPGNAGPGPGDPGSMIPM